MKRSIFAFALLGVLGCFLPFALGMSWFDLRHLDDGWTVWLVLAAYSVPLFTAGETDRTAGIVGTACFGYVALEVNTDVLDLFFHASIGGIMMGVAMIGGLVCSLRALAAKR